MTSPAAAEWAKSWPLVLSCALGLSLSAVGPYALGQFMSSLEHEFGWSRSQSSAGLSVGVIFGFVLAPIVGRLVDRVDARLIAIPGVLFYGLVLAAFSLADGSTASWLFLWSLHAIAAAVVGPTVWVSVIAGSFSTSRSLAIAIALSGTAIGSAFAPVAARYLIDAYQWRMAWQLLALLWGGAILLVAVPFFVDRRDRRAGTSAKADAEPGPPLRELFCSPNFLRLAFVVLFGMIVVAGEIIHLSPALVDSGFSPTEAARLAGVAGLAVVAGKLAVGGSFDRAPMWMVSAGALGLLALASGLLAQLNGQLLPTIVASAAIGASSGALLSLVACITARLFEAKDFGVVFGALMSMMAVGGGLGPLLAGIVHDHYGSYRPAFWAGLGMALICAVVVCTLRSGPQATMISGARSS